MVGGWEVHPPLPGFATNKPFDLLNGGFLSISIKKKKKENIEGTPFSISQWPYENRSHASMELA